MRLERLICALFVVLTPLVGCSSDPASVEGEAEPEVTTGVSAELPLDNGEVGVVVDAREVFRKGYVAATVDISFADHGELDTTLDFDPVTGLAILHIPNDSLSQAEQDAFAAGIAVDLVVHDDGGVELASKSESDLVVDASGTPVVVTTALPGILAPLALSVDVPYLMQVEPEPGVFVEMVGLGAPSSTNLAGQSFLTSLSHLSCADGSVAVGMSGGTKDHLAYLRPLCAALEADGTLGETTLGPPIGDSAVTKHLEECPAVSGSPTVLVGGTGSVSAGLRIRNVEGGCHPVDNIVGKADNHTGSASMALIGAATEEGDNSYDLACGAGSVVVGLLADETLLEPTELRTIGFQCRKVVVDAWGLGAWTPNTPSQQFYFSPVAGAEDENTYVVRQRSGYWADDGAGQLTLQAEDVDAAEFVFEQDEDGWVRIRLRGTQAYLARESSGNMLLGDIADSDRFRLISDDIEWTTSNRGLTYHQPITPPAQLDFAYAATIRNCSPATYTETIGKAETRTSTVTASTTESVQLFSQHVVGGSVTLGITYEPPSSTGGVGGSLNIEGHYDYTRSTTTTTGSTWTETDSEEVEVSRTRTLEVPPFTGIEAFDAVRTVENVLVPFTSVVRFMGAYGDGTPLTGAEIMTQMVFNFVEGVPTAVGADYVDIGIRGHVLADQLLQTESRVTEIPGACS